MPVKPAISVYPERRNGALSGWWYVAIRYNGHRIRPRYETKAEAEGAAAYYRVYGRLPEGAPKEAGGAPLFAAVALECKEAGGPRGKWKTGRDRSVLQRLDHVCATIGDKPVTALDLGALEAFVRTLERRKVGPATINRYLSVTHGVLVYAVRRKYLTAVPEFPWQREPKAPRHTHTDAQMDAVEAILGQRGHTVSALVFRAYRTTGMRAGELLALSPDQIEVVRNENGEEEGWIYLREGETKNDEARAVYVRPEMARELKAVAAAGAMPKYITFYKQLKRALKTCGLNSSRPVHTLRHTVATRLMGDKTPLKIVQEFLGHRDVRTTLRYQHASRDDIKAAAKKLGHTRGLTDNSAPEAPRGELVPFGKKTA